MVTTLRKYVLILFVFSLYGLFSCGDTGNSGLAGTWRAVLDSPGGELPFTIEVSQDFEGASPAVVINGDERLPFTRVEKTGNTVKFIMEHYDSVLEGELDAGGSKITGTWSKRTRGGKRTTMNFSAEKGRKERFVSLEKVPGRQAQLVDISGQWAVTFGDRDEPNAMGIFSQKGHFLTGTFMTPTGDYRFLEGFNEDGQIRLSCFDGAHAFLFHAEVGDDGVMKGDFWSSNSSGTSWTAVRDKFSLPDPYAMTKITSEDRRFPFSFPDVNGAVVSDSDSRFAGKSVIVYIFGTWCPNCNDEAPLLVELYEQYSAQGLEIVGLANEYTGEFDKDKVMVERFIERYGIEWPVLIVGVADKKKTAEALKVLDRVLSYPTTVFIGRDGTVRKIHTGFTGPGTGKYYDQLKIDFQQTIGDMLKN